MSEANVFNTLAKPIQRLLAERGFAEPTLPQSEAIPKIFEGKNVLLMAPAGTGKCVSGDTLVLSDRGLKEIQELYGRPVKVNSLDDGLKIKPSLGAVIRKRRSKLYRLKTRTGRLIRATDDHKFLIIDGEGPDWRELRNLKVGDHLAVARRSELTDESKPELTLALFEKFDRLTMRTYPSVSEFLKKIKCEKGMGTRTVARAIGCSRDTLLNGKRGFRISGILIKNLANLAGIDCNTINILELGMSGGKSIQTTTIDEEFAYFVGLLIGDGNINKNRTVRFSTKSRENLNSFSTYIQKLGLRVKKYDEKRCDYCVSSKPLTTVLYALGYPQTGKSGSVEIPALFFKKRSLLSAVLRGIFDTDGTVYRNGIELTVKSNKLAQGVLYGLLCFGIFSTLKEKMVKNKRYHKVIIEDVRNRNLFYNHVGFCHQNKRRKLRNSINVKSNPNLDLIPKIGNLLRKCKNDMKVKYPRATSYRRYEEYASSNRNPSRASLCKILKYFRANQQLDVTPPEFYLLEKLANSDVFWDEIVEIEEGEEDYVYDVTVPDKGNFIGNGVILHNTEAAFLPVLHQLLLLPREPGIKIVYVTPLRALNRDMLERLEWWCRALDFGISVRHGDTAISERRVQALRPPDVLITTPETLQIFLIGRRLSQHLQSVRWVIVDEVHELADNKRGAQLSLTLERLRKLKGGDFQLIGLSATIGSPEEVARFLVGVGRPCEVIDVSVARELELEVSYPVASKRDGRLASELYTYPQVAARLRAMRKLIERHGSTLVFTNTRPTAEILASRFRLWDLRFPLGVHHGSLSSFSRVRAERGLKQGELKSIVCTSSMELGLDIGRIDLVIQYNSPRQVTRLLQRAGRSGHRIGEVAKGVIVVQDPDDALESIVIASRSHQRELEPVSIPEKPFDVLLHALVSIMATQRRGSVDDAYEILRRAYPFRDLKKEDLLEVLGFAQSLEKRLVWVSEDGKEFARPRATKRVFNYYFGNLSMIPELRQYLVVDDERNQPVGILDESFVAEYGEPGVKFVMGGELWRVLQVFRDKVYVKSDEDPLGAIPTWIGEEIPVPYSVAQEVGRLRAQLEELTHAGKKFEEAAEELGKRYEASEEAMRLALVDAHKQIEAGFPLPTDKRIVVEKVEEICVINACLGTLINRTLARLLAYKASAELGITTAISIDPYRILLRSETIEPESIIEILRGELTKDFTRDLREIIEESRFFRWRLAQVARRMGVLEREAELTSAVVDKLMRALKGTPAFEETFKEVVHKDLDLKGTLKVLESIRGGEVELVSLGKRSEPTPISSLVWRQRYLALEPVVPERLKLLAIASAKARLLSEARTFTCTQCKRYVEELQILELDEQPKCPRCGSPKIGMVEAPAEEVRRAIELFERGRRNSTWIEIQKNANLIAQYGKLAALALVGRGVTQVAAGEILAKEQKLSSKFIELLIRKEREALFRRFKWA